MSARGRKSANPMDKRIPENPKYKHVKSSIDTGASITKYMEKVEELKRDYNFRKDEIFKRMKVPTFVQLVVQVFDYNGVGSDEMDISNSTSRTDRPDSADKEVALIQRGGIPDSGEVTTSQSPENETSRSRLEQVVNGLGEVDLDAPKVRRQPIPVVDCPYLLLDVRDQDAFDDCHIITAKSYPTAMLARSVNYETKEMLRFKNQPGKIILVYDEDERISHRAATTLIERGYDNLFMLSGGLKVAYKLFPDGLITGTIPKSVHEELQSAPRPTKVKETPKKEKADQDLFSCDMIDKLCIHLDGALSDRSVGSRLSKASRAGRSTSISSTSTMAGMGRKPFK